MFAAIPKMQVFGKPSSCLSCVSIASKLLVPKYRSYHAMKYNKLMAFYDSDNSRVNRIAPIAAPSIGMQQVRSVHYFSDAFPIVGIVEALQLLQGLPGFNWTSTILATTIGIRVLIGLPIGISQQKSIARLENLQPEIKQLGVDLRREISIAVKLYNWDEKKAETVFKSSFMKHWRKLVEEHNCHPLRSVFLSWLQLPVWIGFSCALRNVVYQLPHPPNPNLILSSLEMAAESPFWLESLSSPDPFLILPGIFLASNLINLQLNSLRKLTVPQTRLQKSVPWIVKSVFLGISVLGVYTPSAITLYWATSSVCVLLQNILIRQPRVRRAFGIPSTPTQP